MNAPVPGDRLAHIKSAFQDRAGIRVAEISVREYPDETNYIVYVRESDVPEAAAVGNYLDEEISSPGDRAFVIVRKAPDELLQKEMRPLAAGVQDSRCIDLSNLISARSRVSEVQPSLSYVKDADRNLFAVTAPRHHLIFGRRGAGKSALLVEAKRSLDEESNISCWSNMQTLRNEAPERVFLHILEDVIQTVVTRQQRIRSESPISVTASDLYEEIRGLLSVDAPADGWPTRLIPKVQRTLKRFLDSNGLRLYVFVDDFYYLPRKDQPMILDMLHGCVRDCNAWLKVASIRHLTRWWQSSPPLGLQTMHDADLLDLDVTLQDPGRAKRFLENILTEYARHVGIPSLSRIFNSPALDRLVLASGGVPRDYLILAQSSILKAQRRQNAKLVGVQDVNQAAGDAAQAKVQELEEDMASDVDSATRTLDALKRVRTFCLEETSHTYFLIGYRDKENSPNYYNVLTDLLDLRLIHLVDDGVSDPHSAGHRSEAYMLDLSQFSGSRLKQGIRVLDYQGGNIISRSTRGAYRGKSETTPKVGDTPLKAIAILRTAPSFSLDRVKDLVVQPKA
ncbi:hypothetical protein [Streptomyces sp. gb1(2016)]|uniref:hypothetical protein n=1 Tax=Streptomyces sp. gb1(2016) TaxID=1828321 RepID=UPI0011CEBCED|nr:hypothetical protein [Streptomyces sp. gb1(2016)]